MSPVLSILILTFNPATPVGSHHYMRCAKPNPDYSLYIDFTKLLRPLYPGQAPTIRRNMYNVVVVFDLSRPSSLRVITNTLSMLIDRLFPVRFGIVPIVETEDSVKMAKVFYYLAQNYGLPATTGFFGSVRTIGFCHCLLSFMAY